VAAHFKLTDDDTKWLQPPAGAALLFSGSSGTETWLERTEDTVVRVGIQSVAVATLANGSLRVSVSIGDGVAQGGDGPVPIEARLSASQAVQTVVPAGQRILLKAFPTVENAHVLRTVVWVADLAREQSVEKRVAAEPAAASHPEPA